MPHHRKHLYRGQGQDHVRKAVEYATVTATLANKTEKAALLSSEHIAPAQWVPLFRMDPMSKALVLRTPRETEISVRVELQFALDEGLV